MLSVQRDLCSGSVPNFYSRSTEYESRPGHTSICIKYFVVFLSLYRWILRQYLHIRTTASFLYLLIYGAGPFLRSCQLCSYSRTSQHFKEAEGSSPCSQEPSTGCLFPINYLFITYSNIFTTLHTMEFRTYGVGSPLLNHLRIMCECHVSWPYCIFKPGNILVMGEGDNTLFAVYRRDVGMTLSSGPFLRHFWKRYTIFFVCRIRIEIRG
jgi:hypothetical protein